ncbi:MAG: LapA family protein [Hyphomicrobiales bacterium]
MRGFAKVIILVPLALLAVAFALGNRDTVKVSFDPFYGAPEYSFDTPLFVMVFASLILGVLLGGIATWIGQGRHRRAERMHRRDVERLRSDLDRLRASTSAVGPPH